MFVFQNSLLVDQSIANFRLHVFDISVQVMFPGVFLVQYIKFVTAYNNNSFIKSQEEDMSI